METASSFVSMDTAPAAVVNPILPSSRLGVVFADRFFADWRVGAALEPLPNSPWSSSS